MDVPIIKSRFVCIEYPGIVANTDKMLDTLGGERNISQVLVMHFTAICEVLRL